MNKLFTKLKSLNKLEIIAICMAAFLTIVTIISIIIITIVNNNKPYGYNDILDQLNSNTYVDNENKNSANWVVSIQPIDTMDESVKNLAEKYKDDKISLFVGYSVNTNDKNITYAFIANDSSNDKYLVYAIQNSDKKFEFSKADYSELNNILVSVSSSSLQEDPEDSQINS